MQQASGRHSGQPLNLNLNFAGDQKQALAAAIASKVQAEVPSYR